MDGHQDTQTYVNDSETSSPINTGLAQSRSPDVRPRGGDFFIHLVGDLYRALPTMPKPARRFAYNLIELLENDVLSVPAWGDHPTQQPKRLVSYQMSRLELAMAAGGGR